MAKGLLVIVIFVVLAIGAVVMFPKMGQEKTDEQIIAEKMVEIQDYSNKMMYSDAVSEYYKLSQSYPDNSSVVFGYARFCADNGFMNSAEQAYLLILKEHPASKAAASELLHIYNVTSSKETYRFMEKYKKLLEDEEEYKELELRGISNVKIVRNKLDGIKDWARGKYMVIKTIEGGSGVVLSNNITAADTKFDEIVSYSAEEKLVGIKDSGQYVYAASNGDRKRVPYNSAEKALIYNDYIGPFEKGIANICYNGIWGYYNSSLMQGRMDYEYTSAFSDGVSAVKKNGKWGLINTGFKEVAPIANDEIYVDEYGYCAENGIVFIKNGYWEMYRIVYSENGSVASIEKCSDKTFEDVRLFGECGAVKQNGKWGFINKEGNWVIEPEYDDARSFRCGIAAVCVGDEWWFISQDNAPLLSERYDYASSVSNDGCAAVRTGGENVLIQFEKYYYLAR